MLMANYKENFRIHEVLLIYPTLTGRMQMLHSILDNQLLMTVI